MNTFVLDATNIAWSPNIHLRYIVRNTKFWRQRILKW